MLLQLLSDPVHVAGFDGKDFGGLKLDVMVMVKSVLCYCTLVRLSMWAVPVVVFQLGHFGRPACPLYILPHMKMMLYTPGVFCTRSSFTEQRKLHIFLGGRPKCLVFCLVSSLLNGGRSSGHRTGRRSKTVSHWA